MGGGGGERAGTLHCSRLVIVSLKCAKDERQHMRSANQGQGLSSSQERKGRRCCCGKVGGRNQSIEERERREIEDSHVKSVRSVGQYESSCVSSCVSDKSEFALSTFIL
jgi:hypothetical protein